MSGGGDSQYPARKGDSDTHTLFATRHRNLMAAIAYHPGRWTHPVMASALCLPEMTEDPSVESWEGYLDALQIAVDAVPLPVADRPTPPR